MVGDKRMFILLYFILTNVIDHSTSDGVGNMSKFISMVRSFGSSNLIKEAIQFKPSDYLKYYAGMKNEDLYLNATQLITKYGYPVETHYVTTPDGYILTLFRIPCGGPPVFLFHGLLMSSDDFLIAGPDSAPAYLLAQDGYDVWLGNARGTKYSRSHQYLNPDKDSKYWNFTFSEIGEIDLPTIMDYVLQVSGYPKLIYIGHSQGTCTFLVLCSEKPQYNDKVYIMIALTIVAYVSNIRSPVFRALAYFEDEEYFLYKNLGYPNEILPNNQFTRAVAGVLCGEAGLATLICSNIGFLFFGFDYAQLNITNQPNIAQHAVAGGSTKQLIHYFQEVNSGNFQKFDYGETKNIEIYGNKTAPFYSLQRVTAPIVIFYSDNDWLVDIKDASKTRSELPNVIEFYRIPFAKFNHLDYLWGLDTKTLVYDKIRDVLRKQNLTSNSTICKK